MKGLFLTCPSHHIELACPCQVTGVPEIKINKKPIGTVEPHENNQHCMWSLGVVTGLGSYHILMKKKNIFNHI